MIPGFEVSALGFRTFGSCFLDLQFWVSGHGSPPEPYLLVLQVDPEKRFVAFAAREKQKALI